MYSASRLDVIICITLLSCTCFQAGFVLSSSSSLENSNINSGNGNKTLSSQVSAEQISAKSLLRQNRIVQMPKDEFNSTESIRFNMIDHNDGNNFQAPGKQQLSSLKNLLLKITLQDCCPKWKNLTQNVDILDELRRKHFGTSSKHHKSSSSSTINLRGSDLMNELSITFNNITYMSIDGQPGENERDKYYTFYDNVNYYLRLIKLAHDYLKHRDTTTINDHTQSSSSSTAAAAGLTVAATAAAAGINSHENDTFSTRKFHRQLKSLEFKANRDPILSSFIEELTMKPDETSEVATTATTTNHTYNHKFDFYEDFLSQTQFGQYYGKNISMIRESVMVFDQICSHLMHIDLLGNLTRPSKQYELIRRMSFELYQIRNDLIEQISFRILSNRHDVQRIFARLNDFGETRPYVRMLGDQFSLNPPNYRDYVHQLTHLLDLYLTNNMTQASFYNSLAELPEDFILLGSSVAHYYETKEVPYFSRFDADYFNQNLQIQQQQNNGSDSGGNQTRKSSNQQKPTDARQSNLSLLTRLFN